LRHKCQKLHPLAFTLSCPSAKIIIIIIIANNAASKDEIVDVDWPNWIMHIIMLLLVSTSTLSKADRLTGLVQGYDTKGHTVAQLVEALRYKPEGRRFNSRWCHWNFPLT